MNKRHQILDRFNSTKINYFDMEVIPDQEHVEYNFKNKDNESTVVEKINRNFRQIPFTRMLKFRKEDLSKIGSNVFFLCSARIKIQNPDVVKLKLGFVTDQEKLDVNDLVYYVVHEKERVLSLNRII